FRSKLGIAFVKRYSPLLNTGTMMLKIKVLAACSSEFSFICVKNCTPYPESMNPFPRRYGDFKMKKSMQLLVVMRLMVALGLFAIVCKECRLSISVECSVTKSEDVYLNPSIFKNR